MRTPVWRSTSTAAHPPKRLVFFEGEVVSATGLLTDGVDLGRGLGRHDTPVVLAASLEALPAGRDGGHAKLPIDGH